MLVVLLVLAVVGVAAFIFAMALARAAAAGDRSMEVARARPLAGDGGLMLRVRRVVARWPVTELDPIERATFAGAVAQARDFEDLDFAWQELIIAAERGSRRRTAPTVLVAGRR